MMSRTVKIALLAIVATLAVVAMLVAAGVSLSGLKVRKPGSLESKVVVAIKHKVIDGKSLKNPTSDIPDVIKSGGEHFQHRCQTCHGFDGHATGVPFESQVYPPIPDLGSADVQGYSDGQLKSIIENGISLSGMPAWHGIIDDNTMWKIVRYIRHLPPKGSLGAPDVYLEAAEVPQTAGENSKPRYRFSEKDRQGSQ
jgi:mono/diheme cytochrome c family protein